MAAITKIVKCLLRSGSKGKVKVINPQMEEAVKKINERTSAKDFVTESVFDGKIARPLTRCIREPEKLVSTKTFKKLVKQAKKKGEAQITIAKDKSYSNKSIMTIEVKKENDLYYSAKIKKESIVPDSFSKSGRNAQDYYTEFTFNPDKIKSGIDNIHAITNNPLTKEQYYKIADDVSQKELKRLDDISYALSRNPQVSDKAVETLVNETAARSDSMMDLIKNHKMFEFLKSGDDKLLKTRD